MQPTKPYRVLVTGLSGFVGGCILKMSDQIRSEYNAEIIVAEDFIDLRNSLETELWISQVSPDWVIHLAAQSNVPASFLDPEETLQVNLIGTLHLLQALDKHKFNGKLLYVSSGDVYGLTAEELLPINECHPAKPANPYAVSKLAAETLCLQWGITSSFDVIVARPFNHIGPGQRPDFVVPSMAKQIIDSDQYPICVMVGDVDITRDFLDVRDVVHAYFKLLSSGNRGTVYNVCSGKERLVRDIAQSMATLSGKTIELIRDSARFRVADQRRVCGSNDRICADTGWQPRYTLDETLQDVLQSFRI